MTSLTPMPKSLPVAASLVIAYLIGTLLIVGRGILVPFVVALLIWHFLNAIHRSICEFPKLGPFIPNWLSLILTTVIVLTLGVALFNIISNNVNDVILASSKYQERIQQIFHNLNGVIPFKSYIHLDGLMSNWSFQSILINFYGVFTSIMSSAVLITLYVSFLFVEQHFFAHKLHAFLQDSKHRELADNILKHIVQDTQVYLGLKTFLSLITAFCSWFIMRSVGLDFAPFWALLIFFLNFIPNIGAIIATAFPAVLALIQFQTFLPAFIVIGGIVCIQFIIGNLIEPKFLSKSLNMSPLVILLALAFWGSVWGILGMFLAVPITVMMMIVFAHFEATRPIAILLSQDGCIQKSYQKI